jgi:hypothetical protein
MVAGLSATVKWLDLRFPGFFRRLACLLVGSAKLALSFGDDAKKHANWIVRHFYVNAPDCVD